LRQRGCDKAERLVHTEHGADPATLLHNAHCHQVGLELVGANHFGEGKGGVRTASHRRALFATVHHFWGCIGQARQKQQQKANGDGWKVHFVDIKIYVFDLAFIGIFVVNNLY
jgi:hypothetical protein